MTGNGHIEQRIRDIDDEIVDLGLELEDMAADKLCTNEQIAARMESLDRLRQIRHAIWGELHDA